MLKTFLEAIQIIAHPYRTTRNRRKLLLQFAQDAAIIFGFILFATLLFIATL